MTEEQEARIEQLNLEHTLQRALNSKYHFSGCNVNDKLKLQIFQIVQSCALNNKSTFERKIETDIESKSDLILLPPSSLEPKTQQ